MIRQRCVAIEDLDFDMMHREEVVNVRDVFLRQRTLMPVVDRVDFSDSDEREVRAWIARALDVSECVSIVWVAILEGVRMKYADFVTHYSDLWFPGSDDIVILADGALRMIEMSHEEECVVYSSIARDAIARERLG